MESIYVLEGGVVKVKSSEEEHLSSFRGRSSAARWSDRRGLWYRDERLALSRARLKTGQWGVEGCGPDLPSGPFKALSIISVLSKEPPLRPWNEIE